MMESINLVRWRGRGGGGIAASRSSPMKESINLVRWRGGVEEGRGGREEEEGALLLHGPLP